MNFALIVLMALLAFGTTLSGGRSAMAVKPVSSVTAASADTTVPVAAPLASPTDAPTPTPYDQAGGGPSH